MSNYLSKPIETAPIVSNYNFELINQVLATKQGQYNYNREKLQNAIAYVENLKVIRPQDQEYLNAKISEMYSTLNMGDKNLSDGVVADTYYSAIMSVAQDPTIVNAVGSTQVINNFYANIQKMQSDTKTMGQVNDRNIAYSLETSGVNAYMRGEVDSVKSINYIPFTDTKTKLNDRIEKLMKLNPKQTIEVDGVIKTIEGLSPQEIKRIAENSLDENDLKQLEVDAWYNSGGFKDERFLINASNYLSTEQKQLEFDRAEIERNIKNGGTPKQMTEWNSKLNSITAQQQVLKENSTDIRNAAVFLQKEALVNDIVGVYGNLYTESVTTNWQQKNYEQRLREWNYKLEKEFRDQQAKEAQGLQTITYGTDAENAPESIIKQFDQGTAEVKTKLDGYSKTYKDRLTQLARTDKDAKKIIDEYNERLKTRQQGQSDLDIFREVINQRGASLPNHLTTFKEGDVYINYYDEINIATEQYDDRLTAYNKYKADDDREYIESTLNKDNTLRRFHSNKNTKMLWNGKAVPVHQILKQRGIIDNNGNKIGSLLDEANADVLQELKKSYFADEILSRGTKAEVGGYEDKVIPHLKELAKLLGESPDVVKEIDVATNRGLQKRTVISEGSKLGSYLAKANEQGIRELWQWEDQSLSSDDPVINNFVQGYFTRKPSESSIENIRRFTSMLPENKAINVTTENPYYESFRNHIAGSAYNQGLSLTPNSKEPILIRNISNDEIEVRVMTGTGKDATMTPIRLLKRDVLENFPQLANRVDFESSQAEYDLRAYAGKSIKSGDIKFTPDYDVTRKEYLTETVLKPYGGEYDVYADADSTKKLFRNNFQNLRQSVQGYDRLVSMIVDNAGDYVVSLDVSNGGTKIATKLTEKSTGNVIYALPMDVNSNFKINDAINLIKRAPEVTYAMLVSQILNEQNQAVLQGTETDAYKRLVNSLSN